MPIGEVEQILIKPEGTFITEKDIEGNMNVTCLLPNHIDIVIKIDGQWETLELEEILKIIEEIKCPQRN